VTRGPRPRAATARPALVAVVFIVLGIAGGTFLALAQSPRPSTSPPPASVPSSADVGSLVAPATGTPESPAPASTVGGSATPGSSLTLAIDPSLLAVLPATVKDLPLVEDGDSETHDLTDPALAGEASALAAALVVDPASGDFAYVSVVHLRPGIYSDGYFRSWRDTFDAAACAQAGGVAQSSAEATLGGHQTFIGHCNGGILTYHVYLAARSLIVSVSAIGEERFGQLVVEGLR